MKKNKAVAIEPPPPGEVPPVEEAAPNSKANPELDALGAEADRLEGGEEQPGEQPHQEQARSGQHQISTARMVQGALLGAGGLLAMRYPAAKQVYTADRCMMVGEAVAPVLDRWGINAENSVFMQYCVAIGALALLGFDTVTVIKTTTHENTAPPGAPTAKPVP